ncbi:MAG: hypothetical protein HYS23_07395 [Geobacter sp.]|nr:hypothetical protein [Geobacter sp.]
MSRTLRNISTAYLTLIAFLVIFVCYALALTIPSTPLFVSTVQQPNVLLLLDVSPTMQCTEWDSTYNPETSSATFSKFDPNYDWNVLVKVGSKLIMVYHDDAGAVKADKENIGGLDITIDSKTVTFPDPATGKARAYFPVAVGSIPAGEYPCYIYDGKYMNWAFDNGKNISSHTNTRIGSIIDPSSTNSLNQFVKNNPTFRFGLMATGPNGTNSGVLKNACGDLTASNVDIVLGKDDPDTTYTNTEYLLDPDNPNSFYKKNRVYILGSGSSDTVNDCQIGEALTETWQVFKGGTSEYDNTKTYTSPISASCQANFVVLFSSGRPHLDNVYDKYSITTSSSDDFATTAPISSGVTYAATNFDTRAPAIAAYMKLHNPSAIANSKSILTYTVGVGYNYPSATDSTRLLQKIAADGGGVFSTVNSTSGLGAALNAVGAGVVQAISSASSVAVNTAFLQTNTQLFTAQFLPGVWTGDVIAKDIDPTNGNISVSNAWSASVLLASRTEASRDIFTTYSTSSNRYTYTSFHTDAAGTLQSWLGTVDSTDTEKVIKTVRGTYSGDGIFANGYRELPKEGGNIKKLGDVVSSSPVYVGSPPFYYSYAGYRNFQVSNQGRKGMVYIGGNDGMLHAFHAGTAEDTTTFGTEGGKKGGEVWAYIPNNLMRGPNPVLPVNGDAINNTPRRIRSLARPDNYAAFSNPVQYGTASLPHQMMVNGTATTGDAVVGFQNYSTPKWGTVVIGTEREGGKGIFALNVTDPRKPNSSANALGQTGVTPMWEYSDYHDQAMGYTYSSVAIARLRYSAPLDGGFVPLDTWVAIFGNGYNSKEGKAYLMVVDIKTGKLIKKMPTDNTLDNGLSSPAVIVDSSGYVKYAYAGDLKGRLYRFDFKSSDADAPSGSGLAKWNNYVGSWTSTLLFNQIQPITSAPDVAYDGSKYLVLFGTGQYLDSADIGPTDIQTFYCVFDTGSYSGLTRSNLAPRTLNEDSIGTKSIRYVTGSALGTNDKGWYLDLKDPDLAATGERVVTDPVAYSGNVIFTSFIPTTTACEYGGYSWLNVVDFKTGLQPAKTDLDITGEGTIDSSDTITVGGTVYNPSSLKFVGAGMASSPTVLSASGGIAYKYTTLSSGVVVKTTETGSAAAGSNFIRAWREIFPYQGI